MSLILLSIYIILIFIRPMDWWEPVLNWQLVNITAIATLLVSLPQILERGRTLWRNLLVVRLMIALWVGIFISWIYPMWLAAMSTAFQEFGKIVILYLLILLLARTQKNWRFLIWTILLCTTWMAVHTMFQVSTGRGFGDQVAYPRSVYGANGEVIGEVIQPRAYGIFSDPNDLCLVFIVAIPLLYAIVRASRNMVARSLAVILLPFMLYAAWLTNSRGGILGVFGMLVAHAIVRTKTLFRRYLLASVSVALVTVVAPARFSFAADPSRANNWGDGISFFKRFPIFGVGWGAFADYSPVHQVAHNSYITALAELGIVGYIPFVLLIYTTMVQLRRAINLKGLITGESEFYLSGMFSALTGYLTAIYFLTRTYNHVLYILLALATAQTVIACQSPVLYHQIFSPWRQDLRRGLFWSVASIAILWVTVRICNGLLGR